MFLKFWAQMNITFTVGYRKKHSKAKQKSSVWNRNPTGYIWYNRAGVNSPNLPSGYFTSPAFLIFPQILHLVRVVFSVSGQKLHYKKNSLHNWR